MNKLQFFRLPLLAPLILVPLIMTPLTLAADPAVFHDGIMTIPEGAVVSDQGNSYFTNITLAMDNDGKLVLTGASMNSLVSVDDIDVQIMESFPLQVSIGVSGYLSVPCVKLLSPAISYADNRFTIVLAESRLGPAESCIQVLEPFETTVPLDVEGLPAGTYTVDVNGVTAEFTFDADNTGLN